MKQNSFSKEQIFADLVIKKYQTLLAPHKDLEIEAGKNILTDVTCIFEKGRFELIHGFSQTDIVIFKDQISTPTNEGLIKFYNDKKIRSGVLSIPFVVLELKSGELTTDSIRSRDFVASRIKQMFPFSAYYFLAEETTKEEKTLLRQGKSFTNYFISKSKMDEAYLEDIFNNYIEPHINNLRRQLNRLSQ